jgi:nucleoside-diphosphate-sugar epimerase
MSKIILVAGATGNLGAKIIDHLLKENVQIRAIVRKQNNEQKILVLKNKGVEVFEIDNFTKENLLPASKNVDCIISAVAGLQHVIIDAQTQLLEAALECNVPRFIPSDFSSCFTNLTLGNNRNLDFRKKFHDYINTKNIQITSIFNGAFMELTTGEMPLIMFDKYKILHWGSADVLMDFTHTENVASYTAKAAIDDASPRYLTIVGERISAKQVQGLMTTLTNKNFKLFSPGGISFFNFIIKMTKFFSPSKHELYPAWQGMQYMRDMMEGKIDVTKKDNDRYDGISWITLKDYLTKVKNY